jgi:hypothetical protein
MKETAVQWLMHQMLEGSMNRETGEMHIKLPKDAFTIAKEMEKEQIIEFADEYGTYLLQGGTMSAVTYNETFKSE